MTIVQFNKLKERKQYVPLLFLTIEILTHYQSHIIKTFNFRMVFKVQYFNLPPFSVTTTLVCKRGAGSLWAVSVEFVSTEPPKHYFLIFLQKNFLHNFFPKIEENLLFIVSFWTYDCKPYDRGLGEIFIFVAKILIWCSFSLSKSRANFQLPIVPL